MAFLDKIRFFWGNKPQIEPEIVVPAELTVYETRPLTSKQLGEVFSLSKRCFSLGENYNKSTFNYLLTNPQVLSYRMVTPADKMVGFIILTVGEDGIGHIATIGVAPEHRRRGIAGKLLLFAEDALRLRNVNTLHLEVRISNVAAQSLYRSFGYIVTQRISRYYTNGEDGFVMIKSLI